jgi:hypothetical protein
MVQIQTVKIPFKKPEFSVSLMCWVERENPGFFSSIGSYCYFPAAAAAPAETRLFLRP